MSYYSFVEKTRHCLLWPIFFTDLHEVPASVIKKEKCRGMVSIMNDSPTACYLDKEEEKAI